MQLGSTYHRYIIMTSERLVFSLAYNIRQIHFRIVRSVHLVQKVFFILKKPCSPSGHHHHHHHHHYHHYRTALITLTSPSPPLSHSSSHPPIPPTSNFYLQLPSNLSLRIPSKTPPNRIEKSRRNALLLSKRTKTHPHRLPRPSSSRRTLHILLPQLSEIPHHR